MTELSPVSHATPCDQVKYGSVGVLLPNLECKVSIYDSEWDHEWLEKWWWYDVDDDDEDDLDGDADDDNDGDDYDYADADNQLVFFCFALFCFANS